MARNKARGGRPGGRKAPSPPQRRRRAPEAAPPPPDLKVQLPYFVARIVAFTVAVTVFTVVLHLYVFYAVLFGLVVAGVLTYPLGRMQKRAARRAAGTDPH